MSSIVPEFVSDSTARSGISPTNISSFLDMPLASSEENSDKLIDLALGNSNSSFSGKNYDQLWIKTVAHSNCAYYDDFDLSPMTRVAPRIILQTFMLLYYFTLCYFTVSGFLEGATGGSSDPSLQSALSIETNAAGKDIITQCVSPTKSVRALGPENQWLSGEVRRLSNTYVIWHNSDNKVTLLTISLIHSGKAQLKQNLTNCDRVIDLMESLPERIKETNE